jgi:hypothetical protein
LDVRFASAFRASTGQNVAVRKAWSPLLTVINGGIGVNHTGSYRTAQSPDAAIAGGHAPISRHAPAIDPPFVVRPLSTVMAGRQYRPSIIARLAVAAPGGPIAIVCSWVAVTDDRR